MKHVGNTSVLSPHFLSHCCTLLSAVAFLVARMDGHSVLDGTSPFGWSCVMLVTVLCKEPLLLHESSISL